MHNARTIGRFPFSPVSLIGVLVAVLGLGYIALIAVVMSYAALTIQFSQSVTNDEASLAALESSYLAKVASITDTDYAAEGYSKPLAEIYVSQAPATALR